MKNRNNPQLAGVRHNRDTDVPDEIRAETEQVEKQFGVDQIWTDSAPSGQVIGSDGGGGAELLPMPASLSDYADIVVVDAGGNGDYEKLSAAFAAEGADKTYAIFGDDLDEPTGVVLDADCKIMGPGTIDGNISVEGQGVIFDGSLIVNGDVTIGTTLFSDLVVKNATINGRVILDGGFVLTLSMEAGSKISHSGNNAIELVGANNAGACVLKIGPGAIVETVDGTGNVGIYIDDNGGSTVLNETYSYIINSKIAGDVDAIASPVAITPLVSNSRLVNGVHANVTLPANSYNYDA